MTGVGTEAENENEAATGAATETGATEAGTGAEAGTGTTGGNRNKNPLSESTWQLAAPSLTAIWTCGPPGNRAARTISLVTGQNLPASMSASVTRESW